MRDSGLDKDEPKSIHCRTAARALQQYLDSEIRDEFLVTAISFHLELCRDCGMEAETYSRIKVAIASEGRAFDSETMARLNRFLDDLL